MFELIAHFDIFIILKFLNSLFQNDFKIQWSSVQHVMEYLPFCNL
jgi:hypothetical protein